MFTYVHVTFCGISCDRAAQTETNGVFESKRKVQRAQLKVSVILKKYVIYKNISKCVVWCINISQLSPLRSKGQNAFQVNKSTSSLLKVGTYILC